MSLISSEFALKQTLSGETSDISFVFPLKTKRKSAVRMIRNENGRDIRKIDIPNMLHKIMHDIGFKAAIIIRFRKCGLIPFNPDNVD